MSLKEKFYPESEFGGFSDIDGTILFYNRIHALIKKSDTILDIGCGRGRFKEDDNQFRRELQIFKGKVNQVIGIDVDLAGADKPYLDEFFRLSANDSWPLADNSVDLAFSDHVLEHVTNPEIFFFECRRVIKPNGYLCIRTPNSWGYIAFGAKIIPERMHRRFLKKMQNKRKEEDVFPTIYRCNSIFAIKRMLNKYHFSGVVYGHNPEPAYFDNSYSSHLTV